MSFWRKACVVVDRGRLDLTNCSVHGAFLFAGDAEGEISHNEIDGRGHSVPTVTALGTSSPSVCHNSIFNSGEHGVYVSDAARPMVEHNQIFSHRKCGVIVSGNSNALVRQNVIEDSSFAGVSVTGAATPTIANNVISGNSQYNVVISGKAAPTVSENRIFGSDGFGISCEGESAAKVMNNQIYENQLAGFKIGPAATAFIHGGNKLFNNGNHGQPSHHHRETFHWKG